MKKVRINVTKLIILVLFVNLHAFKSHLSDDAEYFSENDVELNNNTQDEEVENDEVPQNSFLQTGERVVKNKYTMVANKLPNDNLGRKPIVPKLKTHQFIIVKRKSMMKGVSNNNKTTLIKSTPLQVPKVAHKIAQNISQIKPVNQTIPSEKIVPTNLSTPVTVKNSSIILENNYTNLTSIASNKTNDSLKQTVSPHTEKTNFTQLTSQFFLNFYNQIKGNDSHTEYSEKFAWFNKNIMPYIKLVAVMIALLLFICIMHFGVNKTFTKKGNGEMRKERFQVKKDPTPTYKPNTEKKENVIKVSEPEKKRAKIMLKGRVQKIPNAVNYNELFLDSSKFEEKSIHKDTKNNLDDFLNIVKSQEENNIPICSSKEAVSAKHINILKKQSLPKTNQDLLLFEEAENKAEEIDYNLDFLKGIPSRKETLSCVENDHKEEAEIVVDDNESVRLINKLRNSGAYKITEVSNHRKK